MQETSRIFGIRAIIEAIESGKDIEKVFVQKGLTGSLFQELNRHLKAKSITVSYVPVEKLNKLSKGNHQGVVANISPISFVKLSDLVEKVQKDHNIPLYLLLDGITDVRNFGAIIRTAECCGVHGIIIQEKGSAPINADTVKTSAGAVFKVPICKVDHIKDALFHLQTYDVKIVAATEKTDDMVYDIDLKQPVALVMGDEAKGVSNSILKLADYRAKLPMLGEIASLNVSVACGAVLYETVRQRS